jgi:predicted lipoprotein with Yx(FWY)xxD motif
MLRTVLTRSWRRTLVFGVLVVATAIAVPLAMSASGKRVVVVRVAHNAKLGRSILVTRRGRTLYDLSVERNGKFICATQACLSLWHPLHVARGTRPAGAPHLGVVTRPDRTLQVTYRGRPLYTFTGDKRAGDVSGDGFKDVGVWHPAATSGAKSTTPPPTRTYSYPY